MWKEPPQAAEPTPDSSEALLANPPAVPFNASVYWAGEDYILACSTPAGIWLGSHRAIYHAACCGIEAGRSDRFPASGQHRQLLPSISAPQEGITIREEK